MLNRLPDSKWSFTTAAHLLNRAAFGGSPMEIQALQRMGLDEAVSLLVDYEKIPDPNVDPAWAKPDPEWFERRRELRRLPEEERRKRQRAMRQLEREHLIELRAWWIQRMATGPRPLQEKMALFWHGHFATSMEKVKSSYFMWLQNETFRRLATGNWLQLHIAVAKDPAMLIYLDQAKSRREHPNENYAREVMELFALGEGHYTEKDIAEAARALTGWTLNMRRSQFEYRSAMHDGGAKTFLGRTGNLTGTDVLAQVVAQPQTDQFIAAKVWNFFAGQPPSEALTAGLARVFRQNKQNFKPLLRLIFRSEEFYWEPVIRNQIKSPVQWLVSSVRMLERDLPPAAFTVNALRTLGQELFAPPNVKGWDGGAAWITTSTLLARYNLAATLVEGDQGLRLQSDKKLARMIENRLHRRSGTPAPVDVEKILSRDERRDKKSILAALEGRLIQSKLKAQQEKALQEYLDSQGELDEIDILHVIRLMMSTPEFQLT